VRFLFSERAAACGLFHCFVTFVAFVAFVADL
jgi:hypothetical protein